MRMKRIALALIIILALSISIIAGMQALDVAKANFLPAPAIIIYSPAPIISTNTSIPLNVGVNILKNSPKIVRILYSIDGNSNVTLTNLTRTYNVWFDPDKVGSEFRATSILDNLAEGNHTLKIYSQDAAGKEMSSSVEFVIDTHYKYPEVVLLSPQNTTYASTEVSLTFTCDRQIWSADYVLEGEEGHMSLSGNTTLTRLSNGTHTITVYVFTTEREQANSQTVHFTASSEPQLQPEPFPTKLIIASIIAVVVISIGLLVYFKKRKHEAEHSLVKKP
jgi:hypothetical protein